MSRILWHLVDIGARIVIWVTDRLAAKPHPRGY